MKSETINLMHVALGVSEQATGCRGAGGYIAYAEEQGYKFVEVVDWSSSAGDWTFLVSKNGTKWFIMWQENNYPRPGFTRTVEEDRWYIGSAADVLDLICEKW